MVEAWGTAPPVLYGIRFADVRVFRENRCKPIRILCQPRCPVVSLTSRWPVTSGE